MSTTTPDRIRLSGLSARGYHGVLPFERTEGQLFTADVTLDLGERGTAVASVTDAVKDAVDYSEVARAVVAVIEGEPVSLIETLAARVGEAVLAEPTAQVQEKSAVDFLIESVRDHGDNLVIVPTGPSTTIAAAIDADPSFAENARIVMMGGALTVPGNVSPVAEANVNQDPEATDRLFRTAADVTMIGLDVTLQTLLTYEETAQWRALGTPGGDFLAEATDYYIRSYETNSPHLGGCGLHDPLAVGVAVDPSLVELFDVNLKVDTEGELRGRVIADETRLNDPLKTAHVAISVDKERFVSEFMRRITGLVSR